VWDGRVLGAGGKVTWLSWFAPMSWIGSSGLCTLKGGAQALAAGGACRAYTKE
jgi:hypothetical protein